MQFEKPLEKISKANAEAEHPLKEGRAEQVSSPSAEVEGKGWRESRAAG